MSALKLDKDDVEALRAASFEGGDYLMVALCDLVMGDNDRTRPELPSPGSKGSYQYFLEHPDHAREYVYLSVTTFKRFHT